MVGILQAFAIFFLGFVGRPIGAAIFGHRGDRKARKATLIATLLVTGLATVAVGLVPTYESIVTWAAVLLTITRLSKASGSAAPGAARSCRLGNWREPLST